MHLYAQANKDYIVMTLLYSKDVIMKTLHLIVIAASMTFLIGCDKNDTEEYPNPNVEKYIELLKSNQYDLIDLPAFTYHDIPALLKYRNETQTITKFPRNSISSLWMPECKLGMYVLWTVESTRAVAINSEYLIMRFPSQNPVLGLRNATENSPVSSDESHRTAAKAYYEWWHEHRNESFSAYMNIDPLGKTAYQWE